MIRSFADRATEDLFNGRNTSDARRVCSRQLWTVVRRKLDQLDSVVVLSELRIPPGNNLEALHGTRDGQCSIRVNERYRICFRWSAEGPDEVEVVDYHRLRRGRRIPIMVRVPTHRVPTHPGEMLAREFLEPMGMTQRQLARQIRVPYQRVNELVNRRRGVTPATALRLSRLFGNSPDFWMNLQQRWDLYRARSKEAEALKQIRPLRTAGSRQGS